MFRSINCIIYKLLTQSIEKGKKENKVHLIILLKGNFGSIGIRSINSLTLSEAVPFLVSSTPTKLATADCIQLYSLKHCLWSPVLLN